MENSPHIKYSAFLKNQQEPERTAKTYVSFWLKHIEYCRSGVYVGGVYISGWLYWHINFFKIPIDVKNKYGEYDRDVGTPHFRDNEWLINWGIDKAKIEKRPLMVFGSRRIAKSVILSSKAAYTMFLRPNSNTLIIGADADDLKNITEYIDKFYDNRPDCFSDLRMFGQWRGMSIDFNKKEVTKRDVATGERGKINPITSKLMNITTENSTNYSLISVKNLEHGKKVSKKELLAGGTPSEVIVDEVGKFAYNEQYAALRPALLTSDGEYRTIPMFTGTGGSIELSSDAQQDFLHTEDSGFLHVDIDEFKRDVKERYFQYKQVSNANVGLFPAAEMSNAGGKKIDIPLSEYLNRTFTDEQLEDLEGFNIKVTNWDEAKERVQKEINKDEKKSDKDGKKARMYYPFQPEDCFINTGTNIFPTEEASRAHKAISDSKDFGELVDLEEDANGNVLVHQSEKELVMAFPYKGGSHDAPVAIYERPIHDDPRQIKYGTYVMGFDGYKIATSDTTDSVGSCYVFKRQVGIRGYQHQIVASYASRPSREDDFHQQVYLLAKMYNAEILPESDVPFYKFLEGIGQTKYLADCKSLAEGIVKGTTKATLTYGLPTSAPNKEYYMKKNQSYAHKKIIIGYDDETEDPVYTKGVVKIPDVMLLKEIMEYRGSGNYDRLASFGHALCWDAEMATNHITGTEDVDGREKFDRKKFVNAIRKKDGRKLR